MADPQGTDPAAATPTPAGSGPQAFDSGWAPRARDGRQIRPSVPQSFQTRLTLAFMGVVALTLALVAPIVINRIDDYFRQLEEQSLTARANATAGILTQLMLAAVPDDHVVIREFPDGTVMLHPAAREILEGDLFQLTAQAVAQADTEVAVGLVGPDTDGVAIVQPEPDLVFTADLQTEPEPGQAQDPAIAPQSVDFIAPDTPPWGLVVTLSNPYTSRASTLANVTALLLIMASVAFLVAVLVAAFLAHRFTTPLTRLTEASRRLADGDLSSRVASDELSQGTLELRELSQQFNAMADRLEESVNIIRRDRDYSREFAADVSHELRTPIAAMKLHVELLQGPAGSSEAARAEFLHSSAQQLDRLDWLAQNLLELSKLDSGLVLLDLRPEDVRGTIESAVEQQRDRRRAQGDHAPGDGPRSSAPDPPRSAARRADRVQPRGQRPQVHAARRRGAGPGTRGARRRGPDRGRRHGRGHGARRAAPHLRPLLPGRRGERGALHRLGPRARDREVDRRHAPRLDRGREPPRRGLAVRRGAAARPALGGRRGAAGARCRDRRARVRDGKGG